MLEDFIIEKAKAHELYQENYYEIVDYLLKNGADKSATKIFLALDSFGMSKREVLYLALAIRDSGRVIKYNQPIFEKHSTGGIGDSSSLVLIPLLACLGYKVIKTTAKSLVFTNGSADRFKAIPNFRVKLTDEEIKNVLDETNACILSHNGDICPADRILFEIIEKNRLESNINFLTASIVAKKLASGAKLVLVDVKYGQAAIVKSYLKAKKMAKLLKYLFSKCDVRSIIVLTNTVQTFGEGIGNSAEVVDALNTLQGKKGLLREVSSRFAVEMITSANPKITRQDAYDMVYSALDNGSAYQRFLEIVHCQGGDEKILEEAKLFKPYKSVNFISDRDGYIGSINSLLLGELVRRLCSISHDDNLGIVLRVKIGDYVRKGDIILSYYYKNDEDLNRYKKAILGCIGITDKKIKPVNPIKKVIKG